MSDCIKTLKLDLMVMRSYLKYLLYYLLFPLVFGLVGRSLLVGISCAASLFSMAAGLSFQAEESGNVSALYRVLPLSDRSRVLGRYGSTLVLGLAGIAASLLLQVILFTVMGAAIAPVEYPSSVLLGLAVFAISVSLQFPAIFRLGAVKGRIVSVLPLVLFFALIALAGSLGGEAGMTEGLLSNGLLAGGIGIAAAALLLIPSCLLSVRFVKDRRK